ncbi:MAG: HAD family phosphatase [Pseudomonadota bacterium]
MTEPPASPPIDVVLFDLGGVLIDWNPHHLYRKLIPDETFRNWFLTEICSPAWNAEQDAGRSWQDAIAEATGRYPEHRSLIEAYAERWPEMLGGEIGGSVQVLEALAARRMPLYALTNWSAETFHHAQARFAFLEHFADILVSGEVGLKKPDPAIYRLMAERIGAPPETVLFIDDSAANVAAASALGFQVLQFHDGSQLANDPRLQPLMAVDP